MSDEAIPAATLVVMRDVPDGGAPELLMVTRPLTMAFAGGASVFPGGRVDPADLALGQQLGEDWGEDGAFRIAAIRETIEEAGIAIGLTPLPAPATALALQEALHGGGQLAEIIAAAGLALDADALVPFARWKPAFHHTRRFDTIFYLAKAPPGDWAPHPQPGECDSAEWVGAGEMLARVAAGTAKAIFPTIRNLERLALYASFAEAKADALAHPIETVVPWIEEVDGERWICIPDHLGYPVARERLTSATRD